ncbi:DNA repair protein RecN [Saprospiraceae bacterium]|nr:DNA repair protein RecN [Saprospiraceae bacterium]MDA9263739.1 DNA repair protein RecN [Saprospiraceae bacterium]MDA9332523.1 DNA repair protein RecN [Saprospiraceae bacterium]MDA9866548.1 DNA repair protein RecN [Saprospiraceae bacterium]MDB4824573.1 DNA repair protein RecN [Saprospiraceae bacterium]
MIISLEIQNYAIIEKLHVALDKGLNIITGETGAGKSILLGALGLIMGKRADTKVLYHQDRKCIVEANFNIKSYDLKGFFEANNLDYEIELIIRREISPVGKSRAFVNDTPVTLAILQELTKSLVDMHQQFDTLDIHSSKWQMEVLDSLAGNTKLLSAYQLEFKEYKVAEKRLKTLEKEAANALKELDYITFQFTELDEASLEFDEQESKEQLLNRLAGTEDIQRVANSAYFAIDESEQSIINQLQIISQDLDNIKELDPKLSESYDRILSSLEELRDIAAVLQDVNESVEHDPNLAQETKERLDMIYRLQKKHQVVSIEELLTIQTDLHTRINSQQKMDGEINEIASKMHKLETNLKVTAKKLSTNRKKIAKSFAKDIEMLLATLSMEHAKIDARLTDSDQLTPNGMDKVDYYFSANKGGTLGALKNVASGGEISRLTLVIKSLVASSMALPTLIFDEIDTGVSGEVANRMAEIISKLAKKHQVMSITHSPQIAAKAQHHYFVYKHETETRTITNIKLLSANDRILEIAKMLSGNPPSDAAVANAKELIGKKI